MIHLIPLGITVALWIALGLASRKTGWLRRGEVVFWDAILLVAVFLVWLRCY